MEFATNSFKILETAAIVPSFSDINKDVEMEIASEAPPHNRQKEEA